MSSLVLPLSFCFRTEMWMSGWRRKAIQWVWTLIQRKVRWHLLPSCCRESILSLVARVMSGKGWTWLLVIIHNLYWRTGNSVRSSLANARELNSQWSWCLLQWESCFQRENLRMCLSFVILVMFLFYSKHFFQQEGLHYSLEVTRKTKMQSMVSPLLG